MAVRYCWLISIVGLAVLLMLPSTSWIVREDIWTTAGRQASWPMASDGRFKNDLQAQLALAAVRARSKYGAAAPDSEPDPRVREIERLSRRFPGQPAVYVGAMQMALRGAVRLSRPEDCVFEPSPCSYRPVKPNASALASYLRDASAARSLDPENGYVAALESIGDYAAGRDAAGFTALQDAGRLPKWEEYYRDPVYGEWRLTAADVGGDDGLLMMTAMQAVLLPEYAGMRAEARVVIARAMDDERSGNSAGAVEKRRAIRRLGVMMRSHSHLVIGCLVGAALIRFSWVEPASRLDAMTRANSARDRREYVSWLRTHGYVNDALDVERQSGLNDEIRAAARSWPIELSSISVDTIRKRLIASAILMAGFWWALIWCVASVAGRMSAVRRAEAWSPEVAWGIFAGLAISSMLALVSCAAAGSGLESSIRPESVYVGLALLGAAGITMTVLGRYMRPLRQLDRSRRPFVFSGAAVLCATALGWVCELVWAQTMQLRSIANFLTPDQPGAHSAAQAAWSAAVASLGFFGVPAIVATGAVIYARMLRQPAGFTIISALRTVLPPIVCLAVISYAVAAHVALGANAEMAARCREIMAGEPQYVARHFGVPWSGR